MPAIEGFSRALIDFTRHLEHFDAAVDEGQHAIESGFEIERGKDVLLVGGLQIHEAHDDIGECGYRLDGTDRVRQFCGSLRQELDGLHRLLAQIVATRLDLAIQNARFLVRFDSRYIERAAADIVQHRKALFALAYQVVCAVGCRHEANDGCHRTHSIQIVGFRIFGVRVLLQQQPDAALGANRLLRGCNRTLTLNGDGQHDAWKQDEVANR